LNDFENRVQELNHAPVRRSAKYVLYWAQMNRRVASNHALAYAAEKANELGVPLLFYEGLTCSYPYANDRLHTFLLEGSPETAKRLKTLSIGYIFYLRRRKSDPNDVLYRLAKDAAMVVSDDYPVFIAVRHNRSVAAHLEIAYHVVDSSCIVPMGCILQKQYAAYTIRPKINRLLRQYLRPVDAIKMSRAYRSKESAYHTRVTTKNIPELVASCEIDHSVKPSAAFRGGTLEAEKRLAHFLKSNLKRYAEASNQPSEHATSNLSPYLHFGHISSLDVALAVGERCPEFLEELIVRRELAFNFARSAEHVDSLENVPDWAKKDMQEHASDERQWIYTRDQFVRAETHDDLWNAAQREMLRDGKIHGYYRMYWGKKIIEWSASYQEALDTMLYIHDRWALDGRDPNTYTNILWLFGLHDRPWQPRPIFGKIRYMSLEGMRRKTDVDAYVRENS
jgi:deoxyribodipyrimidine photo-lyase